MKKPIFLICLFAVLILFPGQAFASDIIEDQADAIDTSAVESALEGEAAEIMGGESI